MTTTPTYLVTMPAQWFKKKFLTELSNIQGGTVAKCVAPDCGPCYFSGVCMLPVSEQVSPGCSGFFLLSKNRIRLMLLTNLMFRN